MRAVKMVVPASAASIYSLIGGEKRCQSVIVQPVSGPIRIGDAAAQPITLSDTVPLQIPASMLSELYVVSETGNEELSMLIL